MSRRDRAYEQWCKDMRLTPPKSMGNHELRDRFDQANPHNEMGELPDLAYRHPDTLSVIYPYTVILMSDPTRLPTDAADRKAIPMATGCLDYFPDALAEVARLSKVANEKHNPGQPMHWSRGKSDDHADTLLRHLSERGTIDPSDDFLHDIKVAWRALAIAQLAIEKHRGLPPARGSATPAAPAK